MVPCTVMSMMSNGLHSSACEVDVPGVVGMHALRLASETPSALLDWNNNYGDDPDKAVCFHCSNLPKHFFEDVRMDYQEIIAGTVGKVNTFGTCVGRVKAGPMSFARFSTNDSTGRMRGYVGPGRVHQRSARDLRRRGRGRDPETAETAALHLRERLRASRRREPERDRGRRFTKPRPSISAGRCTATTREPTMAIVAGVDFGTLSVRVSIVDSERGGSAPAWRSIRCTAARTIPTHATQSHADHMRALAEATRKALPIAGVAGGAVEALAIDTTGSSVIPVDANLEPLDDYYLWCDHRAWREAAEITAQARTSAPGGHRVVRRYLFLGMGILQAAALAAPQP